MVKLKKPNLAKRYRRQGYLKGMNLAISKVEKWRQFYENMYTKRTDQPDAQLCLGRVFATEDILRALSDLKAIK